jgi:RNA polymerase sigma-70 factor (ECF subfamily)
METDNSLLHAARTMDKDAIVKIFDLYSSALYNYVLRLCRDPMLADQIVGDVFAKLLDQFASGRGPTANLRSYLYETAYHRIIDETRYSRRRVPLEVTNWIQQDVEAVLLGLEERIIFKQTLHAIRNELTEDQRHVIILRFLEEFSLRETAAIIGKQVSHVKVIQGRALVKLRKALEHKGMKKALTYVSIKNLPKTLGI